MALLDKENNYIRISPSIEMQEMIEVYAYKDTEHRLKERSNEEYYHYLLAKSEELKELRYNEMIDLLLSLEGISRDSLNEDKEQEYLDAYPSLREAKLKYNEVFHEYCRLNDYLQRREPPTRPFRLLEEYIGEAIPLDRFTPSPQTFAVSIGKNLKTAQQAYEEAKALKIFGETRDA